VAQLKPLFQAKSNITNLTARHCGFFLPEFCRHHALSLGSRILCHVWNFPQKMPISQSNNGVVGCMTAQHFALSISKLQEQPLSQQNSKWQTIIGFPVLCLYIINELITVTFRSLQKSFIYYLYKCSVSTSYGCNSCSFRWTLPPFFAMFIAIYNIPFPFLSSFQNEFLSHGM
jgi:hypothetical protein